MPKLEPKVIQKEVDSGQFWPVYWIYGTEAMKSRELLKRIKKTLLGERAGEFAEEILDGSAVTAAEIVDAAHTLAFGGGTRLVIIREAHLLKDTEALGELLGPKGVKDEMPSVCVFLSKDLDGRKKFSKVLTEKAAVVPCEEVGEADRDAWVGYLAKRRGLDFPQEFEARLRSLDPWSLDIVDQELEKFAILNETNPELAPEVLLGSGAIEGGSDVFFEAFFGRKSSDAWSQIEAFADQPDQSLPLLGLLSWNVRQLALIVADREKGTRSAKLNPYLAERFNRWAKKWTLSEVVALQSALAELDFGVKQTPLMPLGLWANLVTQFC